MPTRTVVTACLLTVTLVGVREAAADRQSRPRRAGAVTASAHLLDVPYLPQSEALCGGAAAAMVLRYWSAVPVYAEDFASLVKHTAEGISLGDLARAIEDRGWRALPFAGTAAGVQRHLADARPVIVLIEDRPGRYHYVVVVAWTSNRVVFHDPAHGPFRVVDEEKFERVWAVTDHTALLILPGSEPTGRSTSDRETRDTAPPSCREPLDEAVRLARGGDLQTAETLLSWIGEVCPGFVGGLRELAGIRFLQKRWGDAADLAAQVVERDASDMHAWELLASSRFLAGDTKGALEAWNRRQEPRVDVARVEGLDRTRHEVVADLLNLPPKTLLTDTDLNRAARRVAAVPALQLSRVTYSPHASGRASVDVAVVERPLLPTTWQSLAATGVHAATYREARVAIASSSGNGELWTLAGRWWAQRPRVSVSLATPQIWRWTGLWRVDGVWERQTYRLDLPRGADEASTDDVLMVTDRRRAAVTFTDWASGSLRWELRGALDHWHGRGRQVSAGIAVERRFFTDQLALRADSTIWPGMGPASAFGLGSVVSAWRSASKASASWTGRAGLYAVSAGAPLDVWPAADTGFLRDTLLRAHPLLENGTARVSGISRTLTHGTLEFQKPVMLRPLLHLGWATFVDVARLGKTPLATSAATQVDVGAGLRIQLPGAPAVLRLDLARGLRDRGMALSAGWQSAWPGW